MTIHKFLSTTVVICGILSVTGPSTVAAKDAVDEKAAQRRRDLKEQGPMSKEDADFLRKLMSKNTVKLGRKDNPEASSNDIGNNPFLKAIRGSGNNRKNRGRGLLGNRNGIFEGATEPKIGSGVGLGNKQDAIPTDNNTTTVDTTRFGHEPDVPPPATNETEADEVSELFETSTSNTGTTTEYQEKTERGGKKDSRSRGSKKSNDGYDE